MRYGGRFGIKKGGIMRCQLTHARYLSVLDRALRILLTDKLKKGGHYVTGRNNQQRSIGRMS
jgi:hypothetical protein